MNRRATPKSNALRNVIWTAFGLAACLGCSDDSVKPVVPEAAIEVVDPYSHPNAGAPVGVVYLRVENHGEETDRLLGATTPIAKAAELHETVMEGDRMRMIHHPGGFPVPSHGEVELVAGGKHIMLTGLSAKLEDGTSFALDLEFERAGHLTVVVPVRSRVP